MLNKCKWVSKGVRFATRVVTLKRGFCNRTDFQAPKDRPALQVQRQVQPFLRAKSDPLQIFLQIGPLTNLTPCPCLTNRRFVRHGHGVRFVSPCLTNLLGTIVRLTNLRFVKPLVKGIKCKSKICKKICWGPICNRSDLIPRTGLQIFDLIPRTGTAKQKRHL